MTRAATLAIVGLALAGCASEVASGPTPPPSRAPDPSDPPAADCASPIGRAIHAAMLPVVEHGTVPAARLSARATRVDPRLRIDGPEIFGRMAELIATARESVLLQVYKWEPDTDATEALLDGMEALEDRLVAEGAEAPVVVRIVFDTSTVGAGAPITEAHMPRVAAQIAGRGIDARRIEIQLAAHERDLHDAFGNLHVKTLMVDSEVAFVTGANPEHQHDFDAPWHDIGATVAGDVVDAMIDDFAHTWAASLRWSCGAASGPGCLSPTTSFEAPARRDDAMPEGMAACQVLTLTRSAAPFANDDVDNPQDQAFLAAFAAARDVIRIETPNLNDDAAKAAILGAVARGVDVRVITSKGFNELSERPVGGPNEENVAALYADLAAMGVEDPCARLQVRWYSADGVEPVVGNGVHASHVKYMSVDGQVVIVGTTNMDTASWNFSHELDLAIDDAAITARYDAQLFDADWSRAVPYCPR